LLCDLIEDTSRQNMLGVTSWYIASIRMVGLLRFQMENKRQILAAKQENVRGRPDRPFSRTRDLS
jgi:hypothetical protein